MALYIGLMSGTSMDGIDVVVVDIEQNKPHILVAAMTRSYSADTQKKLKHILTIGQITLADVAQLHVQLGQEFASAVNDLLTQEQINSQQIIAIGSHGQTVLHAPSGPQPVTVQLGCPHTISVLTKRPVVADFRGRDIALGGQGAPLAPLYHPLILGEFVDEVYAVVNIGGISNVSICFKDQMLAGFDCGPGNCLLDAWTKIHLGKAYDINGEWALTGQVSSNLLDQLLTDSYFNENPRRSLDKNYFSLDWLNRYLRSNSNHTFSGISAVDVQATLAALTASAIATSIKASQYLVSRIILCGGGAHNNALLTHLSSYSGSIPVETTQAFGLSPDYIEAMMMAWLASMRIQGHKLHWQKITGARESGPALLGVVY